MTEKRVKIEHVNNFRLKFEIEVIDDQEGDTNVSIQFTNDDGEMCEKQICTIEPSDIRHFTNNLKRVIDSYSI